MALSKPSVISVLTKEDTNFLRLADLVVRVSPRVVKMVFDKHFCPAGLQIFLNQKKGKLEALCKKRVIYKSQMDILFPHKGPSVTSSDIDLQLMLTLIRNFTNVQIPDTLPAATDISEGDDLSRIRHYRNFIAHSADGRVSDADFYSAWTDASDAINRIGGVLFKVECDSLLVAELDSSYGDVYLSIVQNELRLKQVEDDVRDLHLQRQDPVPSNVREHMLSKIDEWRTDQLKFFVTSAAKKIFDKVMINSFVVITGSPGIGKSATAHHIALELKTFEQFDILPVRYPQNITKYCKTGCNQLFVVDDICGNFAADETLTSDWERISSDLIQLIARNPNSLRVLGTCRLHIFKCEKLQHLSKTLSITECNLHLEYFELSTDEKRSIASKHFNIEIVQKLSDEIVNHFDMFPLLCELDQKKNLDIFSNPDKKGVNTLTEIFRMNAACFVGLALLIIHDNKLDKTILQDRTEQALNEIIDELSEICQLTSRPLNHQVLKALQNLTNTYIKEETDSHTHFETKHNRIFDILSCYFGNNYPEIVLKYCSDNFISQRVRLASEPDSCKEYMILISTDMKDRYNARKQNLNNT